jgi:hypothetical protein
MTAIDPYMDPLRKRVLETLGANAVALGLRPRAPSEPSEGMQQIALNGPERALVKGMMHASGADAGFDRTIGRMTGGQFSPSEVKALEDMALKALHWDEAMQLRGIEEGPPVTFTPAQKGVVDSLMGRLGDDELARRTREAYARALREGQVRVDAP